ncbi:MAG TPA: TRAP transporter large permease, partial [Geminicoccaceae bacterium]|nr:TRAP transporter large permease [Geminicoccaceae bacterium]
MSGLVLAGLSFAVMLVLLALRMPIAIAMFSCGSVGYVLLAGWQPYLAYLETTPYYVLSNYTLSVIPLFLLMGAFAEQGGLSQRIFAAANAFIGHVRGGIAMAAVGARIMFGAICGSSIATTASMGRAALPELKRYGYADSLATGTLGILVPPSVILIIYAITTEQNIAKLFMAALVPALIAACFYALAIAWTVRRDPAAGPAHSRTGWAERARLLLGVWPILLIAVVVVGGIYGGVFTPPEGAAVGAVATLVVGLSQRTLGRAGILRGFTQAAETTAMIFLILLGAEVFNAFLALSQLPAQAAGLVANFGLPPYAVLVALLVFYIILAGVMDELAMLLLTLPVFFPVIVHLGYDPVWFGILIVVVVEIGLISPPVGMNLFVLKTLL